MRTRHTRRQRRVQQPPEGFSSLFDRQTNLPSRRGRGGSCALTNKYDLRHLIKKKLFFYKHKTLWVADFSTSHFSLLVCGWRECAAPMQRRIHTGRYARYEKSPNYFSPLAAHRSQTTRTRKRTHTRTHDAHARTHDTHAHTTHTHTRRTRTHDTHAHTTHTHTRRTRTHVSLNVIQYAKKHAARAPDCKQTLAHNTNKS